MNVSDILKELELEELIGTPFEEYIRVVNYKKGERIFYDSEMEISAEYILEGQIQYIIYTPEGGEFYVELFPGDVTGINLSLVNRKRKKFKRNFEGDMVAKTDSIMVKLPFEKIFELDFPGKLKAMEKIMMMAAMESMKRSKYFLYKTVSTDEEFFLKALELGKISEMSTRETAQALNINLRTLQRIIKNLTGAGIVRKAGRGLEIVDPEVLEEYKVKFDR